jgi:hypothetical protein
MAIIGQVSEEPLHPAKRKASPLLATFVNNEIR